MCSRGAAGAERHKLDILATFCFKLAEIQGNRPCGGPGARAREAPRAGPRGLNHLELGYSLSSRESRHGPHWVVNPHTGGWPRATMCPFFKLHVKINDGRPRLAKTRGGGIFATKRVGDFCKRLPPSPHGPYRRPEGSVAGFHRCAHSAGPGMVPPRVEPVGSGFDGPMDISKCQVRTAI